MEKKTLTIDHTLLPAFFPWTMENFPWSGDDSGTETRPLCRVGVSGVLFLLFQSGVASWKSASGGRSSGIVGVGCNDRGLAGGVELLKGLLEERGGVFAGAATFHAGGDVAPEAGGEGVFDFLLGD